VILERLKRALAGRYRLDREVGSGGMAVVYLAEDLKHERRVALKVLRPELGYELGADRFLREIRVAAGLSHPNILPLFDSGDADGLLYFVMPYVEGETLRERLTREGRLPLEEAVRIVSEVADALSRAHEAGIVHRDVKPENILLEGGHALVSDFGVSRAVDAAGGDRLTRTGVAIGTPAYMSPEQAGGQAVEDARTDVYALGCVAYEMLVGQPPYTGSSAHAVVAGHIARPVPSLRGRLPDAPAGVDRVIGRALAKDPDERWSTAAELAMELRGAITARARAEEQRREARRRWVLRAGGLVGVVALSLVIWWGDAALSGPAIERLAVLPASNLTRDPEQDYFVDGVHEALIGELQRAGVSVIARQSVLRYRASEKPIAEIAAELGVDALLQPAVARQGDSVLVQVSLYDTRSDVAIWSQDFTEPVSGVLGLYRDVTGRIAGAIGVALSGDADLRLAERPEVDPQVYELVLRGRYHQRQFTPPDFDLAEQYFERALALDSTHAPAYLGLATVWSSRSQASLLPTASTDSVVRRLHDRARELDPELVEADRSHAGFLVWRAWEWDAGYAAYRRALQVDANNAETHAFLSMALVFQGRWEEADEHRRRAVELDPLNPLILGMAGMQVALAGRFEEAVEALEALAAANPGAGLGETGLRPALHQLGRHAEALAVTRAHHERRGDAAIVTAIEEGLRDGGPHEGFRRAADALSSRSRETSPLRIADYYALAEEWESALEWIEAAVDVRDANAPVIGCVPTFWPLHDDPRFRAIVERMGLPLLQGQLGQPVSRAGAD
jgi:eukaryotic-like serine/threonine-protein kinase